MNDKYVYFRNVANVADDDDQTSSCLYPLSRFEGGYTIDSTMVMLNFKCMHEFKSTANTATDNVVINTSTGSSGTVFRAIMEEFSNGENYLIEIGDDVSGKYSIAGVTSIFSITVNIQDT
tara:strand:+ start:423 stop:782 length:360 start_codon:yes stop_codon:yes gene_type:complete